MIPLEGVPLLTDPAFAALTPGIVHGFTTRSGGASTGVFQSLNLGRGSQDDPAAVAENRRRVAQAFGARDGGRDLLTLHQIHGAGVRVVEGDVRSETVRVRADAQITRAAGPLLAVLVADCVPVLLADPAVPLIATIHAGWRGALAGIVEATLAAMVAQGAQTARMAAVLGPAIAQASYQVGPELRAAFLARHPDSHHFFAPDAPGADAVLMPERADAPAPLARSRFDLPGFVAWRLLLHGVGTIGRVPGDTYAEPQRFFSARRSAHEGAPDYGRLAGVITIAARTCGL